MKVFFRFSLTFVFLLAPLNLNAKKLLDEAKTTERLPIIAALDESVKSFKGVKVTKSEDETEASSKDDTIMNSDMCCDREYAQGWAQEISPQESQARVNRILSYGERKITPTQPSSEGQR